MILLFSKLIWDLILIWVFILTAEPNVYNLRAKLIALHVLATILPEYRSDDLSVIKKVRVTHVTSRTGGSDSSLNLSLLVIWFICLHHTRYAGLEDHFQFP